MQLQGAAAAAAGTGEAAGKGRPPAGGVLGGTGVPPAGGEDPGGTGAPAAGSGPLCSRGPGSCRIAGDHRGPARTFPLHAHSRTRNRRPRRSHSPCHIPRPCRCTGSKVRQGLTMCKLGLEDTYVTLWTLDRHDLVRASVDIVLRTEESREIGCSGLPVSRAVLPIPTAPHGPFHPGEASNTNINSCLFHHSAQCVPLMCLVQGPWLSPMASPHLGLLVKLRLRVGLLLPLLLRLMLLPLLHHRTSQPPTCINANVITTPPNRKSDLRETEPLMSTRISWLQ